MNQSSLILKKAQRAAETVESWAELSNFLFNSESGLIARAYPTRKEREQVVTTDEYKALRKILAASMKQHGLAKGAIPKKSGRFVVRVPRTLHEMLELEAIEEGVSLNQLVVFKLAAQVKSARSHNSRKKQTAH